MTRFYRFFLILTIAALALAMGGCKSLPAHDDEASALLVVHRVYDRITEYQGFVTYGLFVDGVEDPIDTFNGTGKPLIVSDLPPGDYVLSFGSKHSGPGSYRMNNSTRISFKLEEGKCTILDQYFLIRVEKTGNRSYTQYGSFKSLDDEQKAALIEKLQSYSNFDNWVLQ